MALLTFLNILGLSCGLLAGIFFAFGMVRMTTEDIYFSTHMQWDLNEHLVHSIASQRAEYIIGALLLLLSFSLQLSAILIPSTYKPSLIQPLGCAVSEILVLMLGTLVCSVLVRNTLSKTTKEKVLQLQKERSQKEQESIQNRSQS